MLEDLFYVPLAAIILLEFSTKNIHHLYSDDAYLTTYMNLRYLKILKIFEYLKNIPQNILKLLNYLLYIIYYHKNKNKKIIY